MTSHNKFSVGTRLVELENAVTELRRENRELRTHLGGQLQNLVKDATSTIQASLRIPKDGVDGKPGADGVSIKGDKGDPGDVLWLNAADHADVLAYVRQIRLEMLHLHARWIESIDRRIKETDKNSGSLHRMMRLQLEQIKRDIGALQIAV